MRQRFALTTIHDTLGKYERAKTTRKRPSDKSQDTQRPADLNDIKAIMLITPDKNGHYGAAKIWYARRHCPDYRYIWIALEFWELCIVILENTK